MDEQKKLEQAKETFATVCSVLDRMEVHYDKREEDLRALFSARGEDLPLDISIKVDVERQVVLLVSAIPFSIQEDRRLELAVAISAVNYLIIDGCFDYDIKTGDVWFRFTNSFFDSKLDGEVFEYMLHLTFSIVDKYNDKFLMLAKGMISLDKFLATLND